MLYSAEPLLRGTSTCSRLAEGLYNTCAHPPASACMIRWGSQVILSVCCSFYDDVNLPVCYSPDHMASRGAAKGTEGDRPADRFPLQCLHWLSAPSARDPLRAY